MHILLIEDDDRVAAALRPALHRHGMSTTRLDHGRGAVERLDGVDVVLLDDYLVKPYDIGELVARVHA